MVRAQANIEIQRAPESVYRFITDDFARNYPRWSPESERASVVVKGAVTRRHPRASGARRSRARTESTFKITQMQPHQRLTFQGTSFPFVVDYRIGAGNAHTKLSFTFELRRLDLMMRPFEKLIRVAVQEGAERTVRNLKRLIESEVAAESEKA